MLRSDVNDAATRMSADTPRPGITPARTPARQESELPYQVPSVTVFGGGPDYAGFRGENFFYGDRAGPTVQTNPFDEWWRDTTASVTGTNAFAGSSNSGGTIGAPPTADVPWADPAAFDVPPGTQNPPPTADPSFPDADPFDVPSNGPNPGGITNYGSGRQGSDLRTFGNNLTLGEFLNTPLANMNYGQGYPAVSGGQIQYGGVTENTPGTPSGAVQIDPLTGQPYNLNNITGLDAASTGGGIDWTQDQTYDDTGGIDYPAPGIPLGGPVDPEARRAGSVTESEQWNFDTGLPAPANTGSPSFGMNNTYGTPLHATPTARDPGFNQTYGQSGSSAANLQLMSSQAFGGNPNITLVNDEERIFHGGIGSERGPIQTQGRRRVQGNDSPYVRDLVAQRGTGNRMPTRTGTGRGG